LSCDSLSMRTAGRSPGGRFRWWAADFRIPTEGYSSQGVVIGRCTVYTLWAVPVAIVALFPGGIFAFIAHIVVANGT
jgi:hypothetical protein